MFDEAANSVGNGAVGLLLHRVGDLVFDAAALRHVLRSMITIAAAAVARNPNRSVTMCR